MNILFIADPLDRFKIYKDTTYAMMAEAARRGHALYACEPQHLAWKRAARRGARAAHYDRRRRVDRRPRRRGTRPSSRNACR